ncbi:MAG: DUF3048 domain-containing protein [Ruminococcaceae bacterium]|nr:DUF3048 domain-containing protein [Oscillospiraceae bacterium]
MLKRILPLFLCLVLCLSVGCNNSNNLDVDRGDEPSIPEVTVPPEPEFAVNPLTGVEDLEPEKLNNRPFAITINNISVAQPVQTGLNDADIVYETEVEGGITRLVALYQDTTKTEKIGTIRSARYAFIDLAMGHNAIYVHHGQDSIHAGKHLNDVNRVVVSTNNASGVRIKNGLASEHTLYAYGQGLWDVAKANGIKTENTNVKPWQTFAAEDAPVSFVDVANTVSVTFSNSYRTVFQYDAATGKYNRFFGTAERKDYYTGETVAFKNVFVLNTTIRNYPGCVDGKGHKDVLLQSGSGYYCVNGTYTPIKWSKGAASNGFTFTLEDGTPLTVNPGNSWVCIANSTTAKSFT